MAEDDRLDYVRQLSRKADWLGVKSAAGPRLKELAEIVNKYGKPWYTKMGSDKGGFEAANEGWYAQ